MNSKKIAKKIICGLNSPEWTALRWRDHDRLFKIYYMLITQTEESDAEILKATKRILNESIGDFYLSIKKVDYRENNHLSKIIFFPNVS
jgi:hypothetical protein